MAIKDGMKIEQGKRYKHRHAKYFVVITGISLNYDNTDCIISFHVEGETVKEYNLEIEEFILLYEAPK